jgi:hypothetical protein
MSKPQANRECLFKCFCVRLSLEVEKGKQVYKWFREWLGFNEASKNSNTPTELGDAHSSTVFD